ncbi:hypothetical protein DRN69_02100 [Candidatus Pacearchaeota archaeon]|nr:MAG: hypothetical protein DRN69_02100 [Candidatus Pacearchaeota archaeon]
MAIGKKDAQHDKRVLSVGFELPNQESLAYEDKTIYCSVGIREVRERFEDKMIWYIDAISRFPFKYINGKETEKYEEAEGYKNIFLIKQYENLLDSSLIRCREEPRV